MTTPEQPLNPLQIFELLWEEKRKLQNELTRQKIFGNYLIHWAWINARYDSPFKTPTELRDYINSEVDIIDSERKK
jgi:hypothetical protein